MFTTNNTTNTILPTEIRPFSPSNPNPTKYLIEDITTHSIRGAAGIIELVPFV